VDALHLLGEPHGEQDEDSSQSKNQELEEWSQWHYTGINIGELCFSE
jgi:hypothetical protein